MLPFVLYFEASIQLPFHLRHLTWTLRNLGRIFFLKMPIQHLSPHIKVHLTLKNAGLPLVFFLDFNSPWYDLRWHGIVIFWKKNILPIIGHVLKADWLTPLLTIRLNFKLHVKWNAFDARAVIKIANCLHCLLTPRNTSVSSKNIASDPYYCYSRSLAVTSRVKRTCSPAVHWCTPAAPPARINASSHR